MKYQSPLNIRRANRGEQFIRSHPDFGKMTESDSSELLIAATDSIADILHGLNAAGALGTRTRNLAAAADLADRAIDSYFGDFEDEPE